MFDAPADPPAIIGRATVIDGDTIEIHGQRIRLWGVDAPESSQTCERGGETYRCGQEAALAMADVLRDKTVACTPRGTKDRYRRVVAVCTVIFTGHNPPPAADIGAVAVATGWALDYPRYSAGAYARQEATARQRRIGMHAGTFIAPWEWRGRPH